MIEVTTDDKKILVNKAHIIKVEPSSDGGCWVTTFGCKDVWKSSYSNVTTFKVKEGYEVLKVLLMS